MIYLFITIAILIVYLSFLQIKLHKLTKSLKETIKEDEVIRIKDTTDVQELYVQLDKEFIITNIRESSCEALKFKKDELIGKNILGSLIENSDANLQTLKTNLLRLKKNPTAIISKFIISDRLHNKFITTCRFRPTIDEFLQCIGMSFIGQNISDKATIISQAYNIENIDYLTNQMNEGAFIKKLDHEFRLSQRYNREFSLISIELKDVHKFISSGVSFEKADKLLQQTAQHFANSIKTDCFIGRFDTTKIGIILPNIDKPAAAELSKQILSETIEIACQLGIDKYNAGMLIVSHTNKNNYSETADLLLQRLRKRTIKAAKNHNYGIISSEYGRK